MSVTAQNAYQPIRGDLGASILGPRNAALEAENPDLLASPDTDAGTIPNLKFSFAAARNRLAPGGWAREVTIRELPVAKTLAGVNMRLKPGGIRELHWHKEAEWAYHDRWSRPDHGDRSPGPELPSTTWARGISGISPQASRTRSRDLPRAASSCWSSTMATFRKTKRSSSRSGWYTPHERCWPRISVSPRPLSPISRRTSSTRGGFWQEKCLAHWRTT